MKRELRDRLTTLCIEMDAAVAARHLDAIGRELRQPSAEAPFRPVRRVRVATLVAAAMLVVAPAAALAAEKSVPGDLLYPIKRVTERVRMVVDDTIAAEHRIEELETVVDRKATPDVISDRLADAEEAVRQRQMPDDLTRRLDAVRDRITTILILLEDQSEEAETQPPADRVGDDGVRPNVPTSPAPAQSTTSTPTQSTTTTEPATDRPPPRDPTTTTSTTTTPPTDRSPSDRPTTTAPPGDHGG